MGKYFHFNPGKNLILNAIYVLFGILIIAFLFSLSTNDGDFGVFLKAAKLISAGKSPYHVWINLSAGHSCLYYYSPMWAVMLMPFNNIPHFVPNFIWLILNCLFLFRIFKLLTLYLDQIDLSKKELKLILLFTCLCSIRFILYNFDLIQMTIFLLWGSLEALRLMETKRFVKGGFLLALIVNIKILPIVIIPYVLYRGYFRGLLFTIIFSILFLVLPAALVGWNHNIDLLFEWWSVINPNNAKHLIESDLGIHSLTALIPSLLTEINGDLPYSRNIMSLNIKTAVIVLNLIRFVFIAVTFYFLKWPPFKNAKSKLDELREVSYILLLIPLVFPHQQKYEFVFLIPALFYLFFIIIYQYNRNNLFYKTRRTYFVIFFVIISFILMTLSTDGIIGIELNKITQHFKTITWGTLFLVISMIIASPSYKKENEN